MEIFAAPRTLILNLFIINPPVIIPKATAGRFIMPGKTKKRFKKQFRTCILAALFDITNLLVNYESTL